MLHRHAVGGVELSVKHLNPRQGITTAPGAQLVSLAFASCETPKSPPGDYNYTDGFSSIQYRREPKGVKHLNPRQGITTLFFELDDHFFLLRV